jgi:tRNA pseudouridine13 synthase
VTEGVPGVGGVLKQRPEDFLVEEVPLYHPCGHGEHVYLFVEKSGVSTLDMIGVLARHFGVSRGAIGHAGLKDKRAVTRQVVSVWVPGKVPEDFPQLQHESVRVLWADLHTNKLKRGHLSGNRFSIRVRGVEVSAVRHAQRTLRMLAQTGVPNRVGKQRFGYLLNNHVIGRDLLRRDAPAVLAGLLGPSPRSPESQRAARQAFAAGDVQAALAAWPKVYRAEAVVLKALARGASPAEAVSVLDPTTAGFYVSSFQSAVFNDVLNRRVMAGTLGQLVEGDVAYVSKSKRTFSVGAEQMVDADVLARLASFELGPSGPLWGREMLRAGGAVDAAEVEALAAAGLRPEELPNPRTLNMEMVEGSRRPLRMRLTDPEVEAGVDEHGSYIRCAFELPRGGFATTVLDEVMKGDPLASEAIELATHGVPEDDEDA